MQSASDSVSQALLSGSDNEAKISAMQRLETLLASSADRSIDADESFAIDQTLIQALDAGLRNNNSNVVVSALGCLAALPALTGDTLTLALTTLLPPIGGLIDRLGDAKPRTRELAFQALAGLAAAIGTTEELAAMERSIRDGLSSKQPRVREGSLRFLVAMRSATPVASASPLRPFLAVLVSLLEDQDAAVRETAKDSTVDLFSVASGASDAAREGLKSEMTKKGVRKATVDAVVARLFGHRRDELSASSTSAAPATDGLVIDPVYIASEHELDGEVTKMLSAFDGKETEANWQAREASILLLRGMTRGDVAERFAGPFAQALQRLSEGILKAANSLRTTLATAGCLLVGELAAALKHSLDPLLELFSSSLLKIAAQTKRIVVQASQNSVTALLTHCTFSSRVLAHLSAAASDKNASVRTAAASHLQTLLKVHRSSIETSTSADLVEKAIARGLADANAGVKEASRANYWLAQSIWPQQYSRLRESLEPAARSQLDRANPSAAAAPTASTRAKPRQSIRSLVSQKRAETPVEAPKAEPKASSSTSTSSRARPTSMYSSPAPRAAVKPTQSRLSTARPRPTSTITPARSQQQASAAATPDLMSFATPAPLSASKQSDAVVSGNSSQDLLESDGDGGDDFMVDDALLGQAQQAEQAAELLLELAQEESDALMTPTPREPPRPVNGHLKAASAPSAFADSPDVRPAQRAAKRENWWLKHVSTLPKSDPLPTGSAFDQLLATDLEQLERGQLDVEGLRSLSRMMLERDDIWTTDRLVARVFAGLATQLRADPSEQAFVTLADLVAHQPAMLSGLETSLLDLLIELRVSGSRQVLAATDAIAQLLCEHAEPIYCLDCLRKSASSSLDSKPAPEVATRTLLLAMRGCAILFERLPAEVFEEELPRTRSLVLAALSDTAADARQAGIRALVAAQSVLRNEALLFELLPGLSATQRHLATYYISRELPSES